MDLKSHPATCIDPLTSPQSWWSPEKEDSMADEPKPTDDRVKEKALKDGEEATDRLIKDLKNGK